MPDFLGVVWDWNRDLEGGGCEWVGNIRIISKGSNSREGYQYVWEG